MRVIRGRSDARALKLRQGCERPAARELGMFAFGSDLVSPHPPKFNRFISALNRGSDRSGS